MADTKLSALTNLAEAPADTDEFYLNDGGVSKAIDAQYVQQYISGQIISAFTWRLMNDSGTLKHAFGSCGSIATDGNWIDRITGATSTLTASPTGTDSSTAFAAGGKISSVNTFEFICDTSAELVTADSIMIPSPYYNTTGTDLSALVYYRSSDVNGTTRNRLALQLTDLPNGNLFTMNTTNIPSGKEIRFYVFGYLA